jgi:N-acetylneuraminic acid mutarotase
MHDTSLKVLQFGTLCMALGALAATAHAQSQGSWTMKAPIPIARNEVALAAVGGKVHVIGGSVKGVAGTYHDEYDPATNSWTSGPPLPTARSGLAYTLYQGLILVLGGELAPNTFAENEAYDPKTRSWRTLAPMPGGRHGTAAATTGGRVYIAAGSLKPGAGQVTDQLIVFTLP